MRDTAIFNTHSNVVNIINDTVAYDKNGNEVVLNEELVSTELARLQAEYEAKEYQRKRVLEYPSIGDQLDALFHAGVFPEDMEEQIQAIKDKYPKV
jgi:hypothetical protein